MSSATPESTASVPTSERNEDIEALPNTTNTTLWSAPKRDPSTRGKTILTTYLRKMYQLFTKGLFIGKITYLKRQKNNLLTKQRI